MRLLAILGLCLLVGAAAADDRYCEPCDQVDEAISPTDDYQVVTGSNPPLRRSQAG